MENRNHQTTTPLVHINSVKRVGVVVMKIPRILGIVGIALLSVGLLVGSASADGVLEINNKIDGKVVKNSLIAQRTSVGGASDGVDGFDHVLATGPGDGSGAYFWIPGGSIPYRIETTSNTSAKQFDGYLWYDGEITGDPNNWLEVSFPYVGYEFDGKPLTIATDPNTVYDVRELIDISIDGIGRIPLGKLENGTYSPSNPYQEFIFRDDKFLSDLDDSGKVGIEDLAILSNDWGKTGVVGSPADITGEYGIPDGNVDMYDLLELANSWLGSLP